MNTRKWNIAPEMLPRIIPSIEKDSEYILTMKILGAIAVLWLLFVTFSGFFFSPIFATPTGVAIAAVFISIMEVIRTKRKLNNMVRAFRKHFKLNPDQLINDETFKKALVAMAADMQATIKEVEKALIDSCPDGQSSIEEILEDAVRNIGKK